MRISSTRVLGVLLLGISAVAAMSFGSDADQLPSTPRDNSITSDKPVRFLHFASSRDSLSFVVSVPGVRLERSTSAGEEFVTIGVRGEDKLSRDGEPALPVIRRVIAIPTSGDVTRQTDPDTTIGHYYTVSYSPPERLTSEELDRAILELYVDVIVKVRGEYINEAPMLEVYALTEPFSGTFDLESVDRTRGMVRAVTAEDGRRVVLDITNIVRSHLDGTLDNNGLIIGSLTGMREGEFTFVSGFLPEGAMGQIRIYRRHEFVPIDVPTEASSD